MGEQRHRGIGRTTLMIANLPKEQCTIVTPSRDMAREIAARVKKENPGLRRYVVIRHYTDVEHKLTGLSEPVFFDHSFYDAVDNDTARHAVQYVIPCAQQAVWSRNA